MLVAGGAQAALVETGNLVLRADGSFEPRALPRHRFEPIEFEGHFDIAAKGGGKPVALDRLVAAGLPSCFPEQIANASTEEARQTCAGAIVGKGHIRALISLSDGSVGASSPLTVFNGPRQNGHPTVVLHARTTVPGTQTFAILVPIERQPGEFRYRATVEVPLIAAGLGALTHVDVAVGRRFRADGRRRSYVSARCSDGILRTFGAFTFADGTIIEGAVEKFCSGR
jgi:hypothetical protein